MKSFFKSVLTTTIGTLLAFACAAFIIVVIVVGAAEGFRHGAGDAVEDKSILHLRMHGQLVEKHRPLEFDFSSASQFFQPEHTLGLFEANHAIDLAKTDKRIKGIYIQIQDMQAGWAALTALRHHVADFAKSGKFVYAYGERLDEKGLYLASAATKYFVEPSGEVEFNGLATNEAFLKGLFTKAEVEPRIFRVGRFKAAIEPLIRDKMSDENREQNQVLMNDIWQVARTEIAASTKLSPAKLDEIANKLEVTNSASAKAQGLFPNLAFEDEVEESMRSLTVGKAEELKLVSPGRFLKDVGAASSKSATKKSGSSHAKGKKIALIFADGEIASGESGRDSIGSSTFRQDLEDAKNDEDVAAVVVRINSPGGDALASDVIWREMKIVDDEMPVVVSMGDVAASGGYYMAAGARYIFAEPTTITGSIGVFGVMFNTQKLFNDKLGVTFDRVVTHEYADIGNGNRPMRKEEADSIQNDVNHTYARFLDVVEEGRGFEKRAELESIAEGRVWSGTRALEIGLVDELGGLNSALSKSAELAGIGKDFEVAVFPTEQDTIGRVLEQLTGETMMRVMNTKMMAPLRSLLATSAQINEKVQLPKSGVMARMPFDLDIH